MSLYFSVILCVSTNLIRSEDFLMLRQAQLSSTISSNEKSQEFFFFVMLTLTSSKLSSSSVCARTYLVMSMDFKVKVMVVGENVIHIFRKLNACKDSLRASLVCKLFKLPFTNSWTNQQNKRQSKTLGCAFWPQAVFLLISFIVTL